MTTDDEYETQMRYRLSAAQRCPGKLLFLTFGDITEHEKSAGAFHVSNISSVQSSLHHDTVIVSDARMPFFAMRAARYAYLFALGRTAPRYSR